MRYLKRYFFILLLLSDVPLIYAFNRQEDIDSAKYLKLAEENILLIKNDNDNLPILNVEKKIFLFNLGNRNDNPYFLKYLRKYADVQNVFKNNFDAEWILKNISPNDKVIVSLLGNMSLKDFEVFNLLKSNNRSTLIVFEDIENVSYGLNYASIIFAEKSDIFYDIACAELIFGAIEPKAYLSKELSNKLKIRADVSFQILKRLKYGFPSQEGISDDVSWKADSLLRKVVSLGASPSVQVLVAKNGRVIYDRAYGTTMGNDFAFSKPVKDDFIYDVASVTKIIATMPLVMKLYEEGVWNLKSELGDILPKYKDTNKANLKMLDILTHTAGLKSWITFYKQTIDKNKNFLLDYYSPVPCDDFTQEINGKLFANRCILDTISNQIIKSTVSSNKKYIYSDLAFMILKELIEYHYQSSIDELVLKYFYSPLGMYRTGYRPLNRFSEEEIVPTENESYWRQDIVHGYVHDMAAALMNGISGHAGIFSTANDMAIIGQMFLWKGQYGDKQFFKESTIEKFTACAKCSQKPPVYRALGFDYYGDNSNVPRSGSYGHKGFTGTALWIDPTNDIVYVFLSNRTFKSMNNNVLNKLAFRNKLLSIFYDAIEKEKNE